MTNSATFWDRIAPKYAQDPIKDMAAYEYTLERTKSYLGPDDRVLEIGCGTGSTAILIAPAVKEIVGTDISPAMLNIAGQRQAEAGVTNASFRVATAREAVRTGERFDAVLAHSILHLVPDLEAVVAGIHDLLPKGGLFISKTTCIADKAMGFQRHLIRVAIPIMQLFGKAPWVRSLRQPELEKIITDAGFDIIEAGNFPATARYIVARKR